MSTESDSRISSAKSFSKVAAAFAILVGSLVFVGWIFDIAPLKSVIPGFATMKANTAISLTLSGISLLLLRMEQADQSMRRIARLCSSIVVIVGLLTLCEYIFGRNLWIDQLVIQDRYTSVGSNPGRMAPATALSFFFVGFAMLLLPNLKIGRSVVFVQFLTLTTALISLLALVGYLYQVQSLYRIGLFSSVALHTAIVFVILCTGIVCVHPDRGLMGILISDTSGGFMARRLLPVAVITPLVIGWLRLWGQRAGFYDTAFGLSIVVSGNILIFTAVILLSARSLNQIDAKRKDAEAALIEEQSLLTHRVEERTAELSAANVQLEKAVLAKDNFLANMSHELRTPLNAIIGFTGTLLMRLPGPLTPDQEKQLHTVQESAKHLLSLINDLLDLAKINSGKVELHYEPVNCQKAVQDVATILRPLAENKGLKLETEIPKQDLIVVTDRRALSQIIINLINNAIKFTEKGSVRIALGERSANGGNHVEISVIDTGIGIRLEDQDKLFQSFEQINSAHYREGTGLGLHLSQKLAALLGGRIEFESEYGKGSVFRLVIPNN